MMRLPKKKYKHIIKLVALNRNHENQYPIAHTCYFTLLLPKYDSEEEFVKKMQYVLNNKSITD